MTGVSLPLATQVRSLLSFEPHSHHWKPRVIKHLLMALLSSKQRPVSEAVASEAMRQLLRLRSYAGDSSDDPHGTCMAACNTDCNPHKLAPCKKSCRSRCKQEVKIAQLLIQLVQKAQADGHDVRSHFRRHLREAHRSHHLAARRVQQAGHVPQKAARARALDMEQAHAEHEALYAKHKAARTYAGRAETPKQSPRFKDTKHEENAAKARTWADKREAARLAEAEAEASRRSKSSSSIGVHPMAVPLVMGMFREDVDERPAHESIRFERRQFTELDLSWRANRTKAAELSKTTRSQMSAIMMNSRHISHVDPRYATLGRGWSVLSSIGRDANSLVDERKVLSTPPPPSRQQPVSSATPSEGTAVYPYNQKRRMQSGGDGSSQPPSPPPSPPQTHANSTEAEDTCLPFPMLETSTCLPLPPSTMSLDVVPGFLSLQGWGITTQISEELSDRINEFKAEVMAVINASRVGPNSSFVLNATNITATNIASRVGELLLSVIDNITIAGMLILGDDNDITSALTLEMEGTFFGNSPYSMGTGPNGYAPGSIDDDGNPRGAPHLLTVQSNRWTPLKAVSFLTVPALEGRGTLYRSGEVVLEMETEPLNVTIVPGFLELFSMVLGVEYGSEPVAVGGNLSSGAPTRAMNALAVSIESDMRVGGAAGFEAALQGSVDVVANQANLTLTHEGGWSPLPGRLGELFSTPKFEGQVAVNVDGVYLDMQASVTMTAPLDLVPGLVRITGIPEDWYAAWERANNDNNNGDPPEGMSILVGSGEAEGPKLTIGYTLDGEPDYTPPPPQTICDVL